MEFYFIAIVWSIAGWIFLPETKEPKTYKDIFEQLFIGGPLTWVIFIILSIVHFLDWISNDTI